LISVHKRQYIIDPQTHIFQHQLSAIQAPKSNDIKKSILKYLSQLPESLSRVTIDEKRPLVPSDIKLNIKDLVKAVYLFETEYVKAFSHKKEYDKYLEFAKVGPEPRLVISPYFMLKKEYLSEEVDKWLELNHLCLEEFIQLNNDKYDVAAQLVMDKEVLHSKEILEKIKQTYNTNRCKYIFIWIDNFNSFEASPNDKIAFYNLLKLFHELNLKPIMAYGGYDSIFLCNQEITYRLYGVAQSVGYGEAREITPVGGGMPTNKYYFLPTHKRVKFVTAAELLVEKGYFSELKPSNEYAIDYYTNICSCKQCKAIIKKDIDNFREYNDSIPFIVKTKRGDINRNRPTTNASLIAAMHFLYCKTYEWDFVLNNKLMDIRGELTANYADYESAHNSEIKSWCDLYAR
jgi:hypothetical protein